MDLVEKLTRKLRDLGQGGQRLVPEFIASVLDTIEVENRQRRLRNAALIANY